MKATATPNALSTRSPRSAFKLLGEGVLDLLPRHRIEALARETGFVQRTPKRIPPFEFLVCTVLSTITEERRGFAPLGRMLLAAAGIDVARSAVFQRVGKASADFFEQVFREALTRLPAVHTTPELLGKLDQFTSVLADDGSVLSLSPILGKLFKGDADQSHRRRREASHDR